MCVCIFSSVLTGFLGLVQTPACTGAAQGDRRSNEDECVCVCVSEKAAFLLRLRSGLLIKMPARPLRNPTLLSSLLFPHLSSFPPFPIPFISVHSSCMSTGMSFWFLSSLIVFIKYHLTVNIFLTFLCTVCCIYVCVCERELKVHCERLFRVKMTKMSTEKFENCALYMLRLQ